MEKGTGAINKKYDPRDHKAKGLGMAVTPFDWVKGFDAETLISSPLPVEDQDGSFSCGGQALRYAFELLKTLETGTFERLSAKDPYSLVYYPQGGTDVRTLGKLAVQRGITNEETVSSYENGLPPSEQFMRDNSVSKTLHDHLFKELGFAFTNLDIESVAQAIRDNKCVILQVNGTNNGTWLSSFPLPASNYTWSHFLVGLGAKTINGIKYIKVKNSWGDSCGDHGVQWLPESYFDGKGVVDCMVFYDKQLYQYSPTLPQAFISWAWGLIQWINNYKLPWG